MDSFCESQNIHVGEFTQSLAPFVQFSHVRNGIPEVEGESATFKIGEQGGSTQIRGQNDGMHASLGGESADEQFTQKKRGSNSEKASRPTKKQNVAGKGKKKSSVTDAIDGSSDEENSKRGPNWKDH